MKTKFPMRLGIKAAAPLAMSLFFFAAGSAFAAHAGNSKAARAAHDQFMETCSMCHGAAGKGFPAIHTPNFTDPRWQASHTDAQLKSAITHGKLGAGRMPAFQGQLSPRQIDALVRYVIRGFAKKQK